jgi:hypothetical protein
MLGRPDYVAIVPQAWAISVELAGKKHQRKCVRIVEFAMNALR